MRNARTPRAPNSQKIVAEAAKISQFQVSRWHDVVGYDDWHARQLHDAAVRLFARAKVAVGYRVLQTGDPKELETFGRVLGLTPRAGEDAEEPTQASPYSYIMNVLVPRPEKALLDLSEQGVTVLENGRPWLPAPPTPTPTLEELEPGGSQSKAADSRSICPLNRVQMADSRGVSIRGFCKAIGPHRTRHVRAREAVQSRCRVVK
jgi:hypothetical protein